MIKERLTRYLKFKRLSQREFAQICSVNSSVLSRISEATDDATLRKIDEASDLNVDWLTKGEGEMLKPATHQSAGNVSGHNVCGVSINGREIHITCPDEYQTLLSIMNDHKNIVEKYQAQLDKAQSQLDELIAILKTKI